MTRLAFQALVSSFLHRNYNTFKTCALNYARNNCPGNELAFFSTYLFDKASDQSWQCSPGENYLFPYNNGINRISNTHVSFVPGSGMQDRYGGTYSSSGSFSQGGYNTYPGGGGYASGQNYGSVGIGQTGYPNGNYGTQQAGMYPGVRPPYGSNYDSQTIGGGGIISDGGYPLANPGDRFGAGQIPSLAGGMTRDASSAASS